MIGSFAIGYVASSPNRYRRNVGSGGYNTERTGGGYGYTPACWTGWHPMRGYTPAGGSPQPHMAWALRRRRPVASMLTQAPRMRSSPSIEPVTTRSVK